MRKSSWLAIILKFERQWHLQNTGTLVPWNFAAKYFFHNIICENIYDDSDNAFNRLVQHSKNTDRNLFFPSFSFSFLTLILLQQERSDKPITVQMLYHFVYHDFVLSWIYFYINDISVSLNISFWNIIHLLIIVIKIPLL